MMATQNKPAKATRVKRETTRQRPETTNREAKIKMLVGTGMGNAAIWAALEEEYPQVIPADDDRRNSRHKRYVKGLPPYSAEERGKISRALNSTRALAIKDDQRVMALVGAVGGTRVQIKSLDQMDMLNRHRFSWGMERLDTTYHKTFFVHLEDHPDSKYRTFQRDMKSRDDAGNPTTRKVKQRVWQSGLWRTGDAMIPADAVKAAGLDFKDFAKDGNGKSFCVTRTPDGKLRDDLPLEQQIVEEGCPEAFVSIWGGEPGAGKTKLAIKAAKKVNETTQEAILYVNGEATEEDFRMWVGHDADPMLFNVINAKLLPIQSVYDAAIQVKPRVIFIDSVQTLAEWDKGLRGQQAVMHILSALKADPRCGRPHIVLISQLNKQNVLKGARDLEHLADAVALVTKTEQDGISEFHIPTKHRGGPTPAGFLFKHLKGDVEPLADRKLQRAVLQVHVPETSVLGQGITDLPLASDTPAPNGDGTPGEDWEEVPDDDGE